jgi:NAD(P)-dependent dehydrogenase (short-subunit alcohol dehydrogenase family)
VDWVYDTCGRLDVLVNCAGLSPLYSDLSEVSERLFDKVIDVNLKGPFRLIAAAGPRMAAAGGGSIVNISSIGAVRPGPGELPYCAAKRGLNALTQRLRASVGAERPGQRRAAGCIRDRHDGRLARGDRATRVGSAAGGA